MLGLLLRADSGIALSVVDSVFFRNWAGYCAGALNLFDVWPLEGVVSGADFVHNDALLLLHDGINWAPLVRTRALCSCCLA